MKELLELGIVQDNLVYLAAAGFCGVVLVLDMYRSARSSRVTMLGKLLGYAPKVIEPQNPNADILTALEQTETRLTAALSQRDADHSTNRAKFEDAFSKMQHDIEWLTSDRMIETALRMSDQGVLRSEIAKSQGLSEEELDLLIQMSRLN